MEIHCPTLILGALEDDVVGVDGSKELAKSDFRLSTPHS